MSQERVRVVEERTAFDASPQEFRQSESSFATALIQPSWTISFAEYKEEQEAVIGRLSKARELLPSVEVPMEIRLKISQVFFPSPP